MKFNKYPNVHPIINGCNVLMKSLILAFIKLIFEIPKYKRILPQITKNAYIAIVAYLLFPIYFHILPSTFKMLV